jgi:hypothetical protein
MEMPGVRRGDKLPQRHLLWLWWGEAEKREAALKTGGRVRAFFYFT